MHLLKVKVKSLKITDFYLCIIKLVMMSLPKKVGPISWVNHWYFFLSWGQQQKKTRSLFFHPQKNPPEQNPTISGVFRDPFFFGAMNFGQLEGVQSTSAAEDPKAFRIQLRLPLLQQVGVGRWFGVVGESPHGLVKENWLIFFLEILI